MTPHELFLSDCDTLLLWTTKNYKPTHNISLDVATNFWGKANVSSELKEVIDYLSKQGLLRSYQGWSFNITDKGVIFIRKTSLLGEERKSELKERIDRNQLELSGLQIRDYKLMKIIAISGWIAAMISTAIAILK